MTLWNNYLCRFPIFINSVKGVISIGILSADNINKDNAGCHGILLLLPKLLLSDLFKFDMNKITSVSKMKMGKKIVHFNGENYTLYEFLMVHPYNDKFIILIEKATENPVKQSIVGILNREEWQVGYTQEDILRYQMKYYKEKREKIKAKLESII